MTTATTAIPPSYSQQQQQQQQQQQYHQQQYQKQQAFDLPNMQYEAKPHRQVQHIGNYVIYRKTLGSGSMGTVKLAECLSDKDHQKVRLKKSKGKVTLY
jgi:hypothetical protein